MRFVEPAEVARGVVGLGLESNDVEVVELWVTLTIEFVFRLRSVSVKNIGVGEIFVIGDGSVQANMHFLKAKSTARPSVLMCPPNTSWMVLYVGDQCTDDSFSQQRVL